MLRLVTDDQKTDRSSEWGQQPDVFDEVWSTWVLEK